uniref:Uncharacterized protein n=1 Tax=Triticum urartu TaxID=4572 RepID=A0A8R7V1X9_TRIUA
MSRESGENITIFLFHEKKCSIEMLITSWFCTILFHHGHHLFNLFSCWIHTLLYISLLSCTKDVHHAYKSLIFSILTCPLVIHLWTWRIRTRPLLPTIGSILNRGNLAFMTITP